jgi:hypothetical protein
MDWQMSKVAGIGAVDQRRCAETLRDAQAIVVEIDHQHGSRRRKVRS